MHRSSDSIATIAAALAKAQVELINPEGEEGVAQETTYVKLNIGAPMSQGVVEVKRIREYIRAHGGYQVDPVASPNWVLMPDGSTRSARRQEVAIYTFLVPLEGQHLDPHEIRREWSAIRDRTILAVRDVRRNIVKRANEAKETETSMIEKLLRQESDGRVLREFSATLQEVPTRGLLDYLRYLIQIGDSARIQSVCGVFAGREDCQRYKVAFDRMLSQFALAECGVLGGRIARICRSAEKADARVANLFYTHDAHGATNRSGRPTSQRLAQIEAPMINALDIDAASASAVNRLLVCSFMLGLSPNLGD
jgi:hypothetical protein